MGIDRLNILDQIEQYIGFYDDSALANGLEKVCFRKKARFVEVIEFKCFEKESIIADTRGCFELYFVLEFAFETKLGWTRTLLFRVQSCFSIFYLIFL